MVRSACADSKAAAVTLAARVIAEALMASASIIKAAQRIIFSWQVRDGGGRNEIAANEAFRWIHLRATYINANVPGMPVR